VCLSLESREQFNAMARKAVAAGGTTYIDSQDHGFMYRLRFQNIEGHI